MYYYVYKTTNTINGKFYIGVHKHFTPHDKSYFGSGTTLHRAIKKHGIDKFTNEIIAYHGTHELAYKHEERIVTYEVINSKECYNMCMGGRGGQRGVPFSEKQMTNARKPKSEATKKKISEKLMGKCYITEDGLRRISEKSKGNQYAKGNSHKLTEETKAKMSAVRIGIKYTDVTLERMSANRKGKGMGSANAMSSAENRKKVSESKIGLKSMYNIEGVRKLAKPGSLKSDSLLAQGFTYKYS